jgi:hypothetical protein
VHDKAGNKFSEVFYTVTFYMTFYRKYTRALCSKYTRALHSKHTRALTFEFFFWCQTITAVDVSKSAVTLESTGNYHLMLFPEPSVPMPEELRSAEFSRQPSAGEACRARNGLCTVSRDFTWRPARGKKKIKMPSDVISFSPVICSMCVFFLQALRAGVSGCACA